MFVTYAMWGTRFYVGASGGLYGVLGMQLADAVRTRHCYKTGGLQCLRLIWYPSRTARLEEEYFVL